MAIGTPTILAVGSDGTNRNNYDTASQTPPADTILLACISSAQSAGPTVAPTLTGNGVTWVQVATVQFGGGSDNQNRITMFRGVNAAPSAGTVDIDFGGTTQTRCGWSFYAIPGTVITGSNGADAIAQAVTDSITAAEGDTNSITKAFAAFSDTDNKAFAFTATRVVDAITPRSGWTTQDDFQIGGETQRHHTQFFPDTGGDTNCSASWLNNTRAGIIGVELVAAAEAPTSTPPVATLQLVGSSGTNQSTAYTTASWTPTEGVLYLLGVVNSAAATAATPTVTGNGQTWTQEDTQGFGGGSDVLHRLTVFRMLSGASPTTGSISIDPGGATQTRCGWMLVAITDGETGGTNGDDGTVQVYKDAITAAEGDAATISKAGSAFAHADNRPIAFVGLSISETINQRASWTDLTADGGVQIGGETAHMMAQWRSDSAEATASASWTTNARAAIIAIELAHGGGGTPAPTPGGSATNQGMLMGVG